MVSLHSIKLKYFSYKIINLQKKWQRCHYCHLLMPGGDRNRYKYGSQLIMCLFEKKKKNCKKRITFETRLYRTWNIAHHKAQAEVKPKPSSSGLIFSLFHENVLKNSAQPLLFLCFVIVSCFSWKYLRSDFSLHD